MEKDTYIPAERIGHNEKVEKGIKHEYSGFNAFHRCPECRQGYFIGIGYNVKFWECPYCGKVTSWSK